jgi:uncharacterized damage-inducible protein DinB
VTPRRADVFVDPADDPRNDGPSPAGERAVLLDYLTFQRQTLELKCSGLDAAALARRSVEPSTMSLLGLVRHLADVERAWFRQRLAGMDVVRRFSSPEDPDGDFDGATADDRLVAEAWAAWREEVAFSDEWLAAAPDLEVTGLLPEGGRVTLREVLVHMIEEYARHNGHADLLRERIDGRVGQ